MITNDILIDQCQNLIYNMSSLRFNASRRVKLEILLEQQLKKRFPLSMYDYVHLLHNDKTELHALIEQIVTNETRFFRQPDQFEAFQNVVLPDLEFSLSQELMNQKQLLNQGTLKSPLRFWSAGCSTGEEAFTIAMCIKEGLRFQYAWDIEILASDISHQALDCASKSFYDHKSLRHIPHLYQQKYVTILPEGFTFSEEIRKLITFQYGNLHNLSYRSQIDNGYQYDNNRHSSDPYYFHCIFCCNVMIYFDVDAQQILMDNLYKRLIPGGYLFTGDAESIHIYDHHFITKEYKGIFYYKKPKK